LTSIVGCDRATKHLATELLAGQPTQSFFADTVRLQYAENVGGFLGLGAERTPLARKLLLTVATGAALVVLAFVLIRSRRSFWHSFGIALFFAGGLSNWIDRALRGSVVDFLNVGVGWLRTGIFNVADIALMLGVAILLFAALPTRASRRAPRDSEGER
jgi:signal peptidase II